ncbi:hypothetical protein FRB95_003423 [Tulasnella sp. JGI-2019a]|nr:hypothetical protein FRB95_003423 [Tulasnella sp. JGI-2019a]
MRAFGRLLTFGLVTVASPTAAQFTSYISEFIRVNYTLDGNWNSSTSVAQETIVNAAQWFAAQGPWSVMNKTYLAPSNDSHDYLSWAPYYIANCSNVQNTTELTPQQIWTECDYVNEDGVFSPDVRLVNDTGNFQAMSDAVFYNTLAYRITGDVSYANTVVWFIDIWFLNNATYMNPNLDYAQVVRGVNGSHGGTHYGVLDLHGMTKVASAVLVLRASQAAAWTSSLDQAFSAWCTEYVNWLTTSTLGLGELASTNNHGTFAFNQVAAIQAMLGNSSAAKATLNQYFNGIYQNQIIANGDQPLESARTRPYHYRAYNAAAVITIHRIGDYLGLNTWNTTTAAGANIQTAVDFAMPIAPGADAPDELYPDVAAIASHFGDPTGKYAAWLAQKDPLYPAEANFFWSQPLGDSGLKVTEEQLLNPNGTGTSTASGSSATGGSTKSGAMQAWATPSVMLFSMTALALGAVGLI